MSDLRAAIEALADEWEAASERANPGPAAWVVVDSILADLRAILAAPAPDTDALAERVQILTTAALAVDRLFLNVKGFGEPWDRGYVQGVKDSAYAVRELRGTPAQPAEPTQSDAGEVGR